MLNIHKEITIAFMIILTGYIGYKFNCFNMIIIGLLVRILLNQEWSDK